MSTIINADTSNGLKLTSDTSGEIKLQSAGADIATVNSSGITMASGKTLPATSLTTASGSAPSYSARAWVNFNGTGTVAIRDSENVSSITDNGTGNYTMNFTTAMSDANYCAVFGSEYTSNSIAGIVCENTGTTRTASALQVRSGNSSSAGAVNLIAIQIAIFS